MVNMLEEEKLDIINEEIIIISSIHNVLHDSIKYREFYDKKDLIGDYNIVMDLIESHIRKIMGLF